MEQRCSEQDLLPMSALVDLCYCERRAALHLLERVWEDNIFTAEGHLLHRKVDTAPSTESRRDIRIARGVPMRSFHLGLTGKADVVEFHRVMESEQTRGGPQDVVPGIVLKRTQGLWQPFPVEYKSGQLRHEQSFKVQLCAQAICLEEMLQAKVPSGAIYFGKTARRLEVLFDAGLRRETAVAAQRLREVISSRATPKALYEKKCEKCSLLDLCLPKVTGSRKSVAKYLDRAVRRMEESEP